MKSSSINIVLALLAILTFSACNSKSGIKVDISDIPSQNLILQQIKGPDFLTLDSVTVEAGKPFNLATDLADEGMYRIVFSGGKYIMLALERGDQPVIEANWNNLENYKVSGSSKSAIVKQLVTVSREGIIDLRTYKLIFDSLKAQGQEDMLKKAQKDFQIRNEQLRAYIKNFADTTKSAIAAVMALNAIDPKLDAPFITNFYQNISKRFPHNETIQIYKDRFVGSRGISSAPADTKRGNPAPDFIGQRPNGKTVRLQDYRGKYVLIDFWASWCTPCRAENPNVVKAYNQFKDKGFDILGVSLDNDKNNWEAAIAKDGLTWRHISELKGWTSTVAQKYAVRSIPTNFLVDPDGYIVASNLRGEALIGKLKEVLK